MLHRARAFAISLALLLIASTGCAWLGLGAQALPPPRVDAVYKGMQNQKVAVLVWADRGTRIDYENLQRDIATAIQNKLQTPPKEKTPDELRGVTFPIEPRSIAQYQRNHPEIEGADITVIAPRFRDITRLIYVELDNFQTRSDLAVELYRGSISGTLQIVEIENGKGKIAYHENDIKALFPQKAPAEGVLNLGENQTYAGTIEAFATEIRNRLVSYREER